MRKAIFLVVLFLSSPALAAEIEGVQPAALDQPRVNLHLRRAADGPPLAAKKLGEETINVQAFLDTGASGVMLSTTTADALGVKRATAKSGETVVFHDVGVGGSDEFHVGEPLFVRIAPFGRTGEPDDAEEYPVRVGPLRPQVGPLAGGLIQMITGGMVTCVAFVAMCIVAAVAVNAGRPEKTSPEEKTKLVTPETKTPRLPGRGASSVR